MNNKLRNSMRTAQSTGIAVVLRVIQGSYRSSVRHHQSLLRSFPTFSVPTASEGGSPTCFVFPRKIAPVFLQYTCDRPDLTSHGEEPEKAKTTNKRNKRKIKI